MLYGYARDDSGQMDVGERMFTDENELNVVQIRTSTIQTQGEPKANKFEICLLTEKYFHATHVYSRPPQERDFNRWRNRTYIWLARHGVHIYKSDVPIYKSDVVVCCGRAFIMLSTAALVFVATTMIWLKTRS